MTHHKMNIESMSSSPPKRLIVGISGVTCGGKTTVSKLLKSTFPWASVIHQDAYFYPNDPTYHKYIPGLNYFNWELETALNFHQMEGDLKNLLNGQDPTAHMHTAPFFANSAFVKLHQPHEAEVENYTSDYSQVQLTILEGHIIFNRPFFNQICDLKFFLTLDERECRRRREERRYDPQPPPEFFEKCVWPSYLSRWEKIQELNGISYIDAKRTMLVDIFEEIKMSVVTSLEAIINV